MHPTSSLQGCSSRVTVAENNAEAGDGGELGRGEDELSQSSARDEPNDVMDIDADRSSTDSSQSEPNPGETDHDQGVPITREVLVARHSALITAGVRRPCRYCNHISVKKGALVPILREDLTASERKGIIRSSMFLKAKFSAQGTFEKVKARLVADGSQQDRELYPDNNSPTVAVLHVFSMLLVAAKEGRHVMKLDIGGAYLNAEMVGESVIMEINKEITGIIRDVLPEVAPYIREGKLLVRLNKALYGCIQSAKLWCCASRGSNRETFFDFGRKTSPDPLGRRPRHFCSQHSATVVPEAAISLGANGIREEPCGRMRAKQNVERKAVYNFLRRASVHTGYF
jgi:hypothetical protein